MTHVHLYGGPDDGKVLDFEEAEDEDFPDMIIIPTSEEAGELYEYCEEDASCGAPIYLYSGYDWSPILPFRRRGGRKR